MQCQAISKMTVHFTPKTTSSSPIKKVTPVQKLTPTLATINVQDHKEVVIVTEDDDIILTEDEIGNLFQDTSSMN